MSNMLVSNSNALKITELVESWTSFFSSQPGIQPVRSPEFFPVCDQLSCPHEGLPSLIQLVSKGPVRNLYFLLSQNLQVLNKVSQC